MDIWRSLKLIRGQFMLFIFSAVVAFAAILVLPSFFSNKLEVYKSSAKVLITPSSNEVSIAGGGAPTGVRTWFTDEATLKALLASQDLLDAVIETAGAKLTWTELRERVQLKILSGTAGQVSLIEIAVVAGKPEESRVLTRALCERFIQYVQQLSTAEHDKTVAFLDRERRNAEREVGRAQKRLLKIGILPREAGRTDPLEQDWVHLQELRSQYERELALAQAEVEQLEIAGEMGVAQMGDDPMTQDPVAASVAKERVKLAELREVYTDRSPQVKAQQEKLRRLESVHGQQIERVVETRREMAEKKASKYSALLAQTQQRLKETDAKRPSPEKHLEYATQESQLHMWQENYLDLTRQLYRARVAQQSSRRDGAFTIVEKPLPGILITAPGLGSSLATRFVIGIPLALILGVAVVLLHDYLTHSMRLEPRIEESLGLPIIGSIPMLPGDLITTWDTMKGNVRRSKGAGAVPLENR